MSNGIDFFITGMSIFVFIPCGILLIGMDNGDLFVKLFGIFLILISVFCLFLETYAINGFIRELVK